MFTNKSHSNLRHFYRWCFENDLHAQTLKFDAWILACASTHYLGEDPIKTELWEDSSSRLFNTPVFHVMHKQPVWRLLLWRPTATSTGDLFFAHSILPCPTNVHQCKPTPVGKGCYYRSVISSTVLHRRFLSEEKLHRICAHQSFFHG